MFRPALAKLALLEIAACLLVHRSDLPAQCSMANRTENIVHLTFELRLTTIPLINMQEAAKAYEGVNTLLVALQRDRETPTSRDRTNTADLCAPFARRIGSTDTADSYPVTIILFTASEVIHRLRSESDLSLTYDESRRRAPAAVSPSTPRLLEPVAKERGDLWGGFWTPSIWVSPKRKRDGRCLVSGLYLPSGPRMDDS